MYQSGDESNEPAQPPPSGSTASWVIPAHDDVSTQPALPPKRSPVVRLLRMPIKLVLLILVGGVRSIIRHPLVSTIALLVVAGGAGAAYYFAPAFMPTVGAPPPAAQTVNSDQGLIPSPQTPLDYFRYQQAGDTSSIWNLLSTSIRQGTTIQDLEAQLSQARPKLGVVKNISYVGGAREDNGNGVFLYIVTVDRGGQSDQVTYLFTLDKQDKIVSVQ